VTKAFATSIAALAIVLGLACAPTALASAPSVTLSGRAGDGFTPDSNRNDAEVSATFSEGVASGSLSTESHEEFKGGPAFTGKVTCVAINGNRVLVGAFGKAYGTSGELPGTYAQVLTLKFGKFRSPSGGQPLTESFGMLGRYDEGLESNTPPNCSASYSFSHQYLPTYELDEPHLILMSPSITSPVDGYVSHTGKLKLGGTGEAKRMVEIYEIGHEASATKVKVNSNGEWKLAIRGLSPGAHTFTAKAVNGSTTPANTVEVKVD
jgi:hypothetical protein